MIETIVVCVNQAFKPKSEIPKFLKEMMGFDCSVCIKDDLNLQCKGYFPVAITVYEVQEKTM